MQRRSVAIMLASAAALLMRAAPSRANQTAIGAVGGSLPRWAGQASRSRASQISLPPDGCEPELVRDVTHFGGPQARVGVAYWF